jgi:hypothetical protein
MRYLLVLFVLGFVSSIDAKAASANDWMFRPSYYSHAPSPELLAAQEQMPEQFASPYPQPVPRSGYRPAHAQLGPGFAVRTKYRFNVYRLWSGRSYDTTIFRNFSFEGTAAR